MRGDEYTALEIAYQKMDNWNKLDYFFNNDKRVSPIYIEVRDRLLGDECYSKYTHYIMTIEALLDRIESLEEDKQDSMEGLDNMNNTIKDDRGREAKVGQSVLLELYFMGGSAGTVIRKIEGVVVRKDNQLGVAGRQGDWMPQDRFDNYDTVKITVIGDSQ